MRLTRPQAGLDYPAVKWKFGLPYLSEGKRSLCQMHVAGIANVGTGFRNAVKAAFRVLGLRVQRYRPGPTLREALERLEGHKIPFQTVVDVGASTGSWSLEVERVFPRRAHLLIEANAVHETKLRAVCGARSNWHYVLKAAGKREGHLFFDDSDPWGGHLSETQASPKYKPYPVTTIDAEVKRLGLPAPFLVKLDTHGVEVPILTGAADTLAATEVLVIECYNFPGAPPCLPFWEMCRWMEAKGFRPIDILGILYRPHDQCFWQFDLVFTRSSAPPFSYDGYA